MIDESMDTEQLSGPPQEWEFRSKPAWQRLIVMLGGVTVNIILGIFIFWMLTLKYGETYIPNDKLPFGIAPGSVGRTIGLQAGDRIVAVNGKSIVRFEEVSSSKVLLGNSQLTILRNGVEQQIQVPGNILNQVADEGIAEFIQPRIALEPIKEVVAGGAAEKAGMKPGDKILAVNGQTVRYIDEYQQQLKLVKSKTVQIGLLRGVDTLQLNPALAADGTLGISLSLTSLPTETKNYGFVQALPIGASKAWGSFADNAKGIGKVLTGQIKANKAFTGPIGIATMFGSTVNWAKFWSLVGLLSMALALMNLLPIPALDGGHAVFLLIEMIKGKPLSDKFMERAQLVGFVILMALMVLVYGNDIFKHFIK
jgi:regulator of sigma E protease